MARIEYLDPDGNRFDGEELPSSREETEEPQATRFQELAATVAGRLRTRGRAAAVAATTVAAALTLANVATSEPRPQAERPGVSSTSDS